MFSNQLNKLKRFVTYLHNIVRYLNGTVHVYCMVLYPASVCSLSIQFSPLYKLLILIANSNEKEALNERVKKMEMNCVMEPINRRPSPFKSN